VRIKVLTAVAILMMFFWVKSPRGLIGRNQRFGEACFLHLQGRSDFTSKSTWRLNPKEHHQKRSKGYLFQDLFIWVNICS
jgi:hypothetical protein